MQLTIQVAKVCFALRNIKFIIIRQLKHCLGANLGQCSG
jgi:hypothetical protein